MKRVKIEVQSRTDKRKLRGMIEEGYIPGVVYDQKSSSEAIKIPTNVVESALLEIKGTPILDLSIDGKETFTAILKELQRDPRKNAPSHISFMKLDDKKMAQFDIPLESTGESEAVRNSLGILLFVRNSIELRGYPKDIPNVISVDISPLKAIGDTITVSDLSIPEGLEFVREEDASLAIATIRQFQKTREEEIEEEKEAAIAAGEEVPEEGEEGAEGEAAEEGAEPAEGQEPAAEGQEAAPEENPAQ